MSVLDRFRLDQRVALITGGNRGLGWEMSRALAEAGASVGIVCRDPAVAQQAAERLTAETSRRAIGYGCDVTREDDVAALAKQVLHDFGQLDILVNNAGINIRGPIEQLSAEEFLQVQQTNVTGPWLVCRAFAEHFKSRRYGRVINLGSTLSVIALANRTPYATSKGAMLQLSRTLAMEWAPYNVTVNCVLPGPFETEMNLALTKNPEAYQQFVSMIPLGRWGKLDEIGGLITFLASDAASYMTGAAIAIDGGWTAH